MVEPKVIATVGAVALDGVGRLLGFRHRLADIVGRIVAAGNYRIVPLYHPSPRVLCTRRSLRQQQSDVELVTRALAEFR